MLNPDLSDSIPTHLIGMELVYMKEIKTSHHQIDELLAKLRNLQVLLEEAVLRGSHGKARLLISEISVTANKIEELRSVKE